MNTEIKTLKELCDYINNNEFYDSKVISEIIEDNGWIDKQLETNLICQYGQNIVYLDDNLEALIK